MGEWNNERQQTWIKIIFIPLLFISYIPLAAGENVTRSQQRNARTFSPLFSTSKFVSFNSINDKIGIDLDLTIPFLSIPLDSKYGATQSLININTKALTIAGIFAIISTIVAPLLNDSPGPHYRMDDGNQDWWNQGEALKQVLLGNSYLAPCTKKFICSVVSNAYYNKGQTSFDKIIDGISSNEWFDQMVDGTAIHEAVTAGRKSKDNCNIVYSECFLPKKFFASFPDTSVPF